MHTVQFQRWKVDNNILFYLRGQELGAGIMIFKVIGLDGGGDHMMYT